MATLYEFDRDLEKDKGYILAEMVVALGLFGMLLVVLWTSYLSVYTTYKKETQKAHNLEEARQVVNFLTDTFQRYEAGRCQVILSQENLVKKIVFEDKDGTNKQVIAYNKSNQKVTFQTQEISSQISNFEAVARGDLYDFIIELQSITVRATVNLKYMDSLQ